MKTIIVREGVENFRENKKLIKRGDYKRVATVQELLSAKGPHYHGPDSPGCLLVKKRREAQVREDENGKYFDQHCLDIYTCLKCGLHIECLRSGWEIGWWNGTESRKLV